MDDFVFVACADELGYRYLFILSTSIEEKMNANVLSLIVRIPINKIKNT